MIAVDTQILVYAHRGDSSWNDAAEPAVRALAEGRARWAIPWPCIHEFFAIVTHPKIYDPPTKWVAALEQVEAWMASPTLALLGEAQDHWTQLRQLIADARLTGSAVHDARIAAICLSHGVEEIWSADRDFKKFPRLKTRNPLVRPGRR